MCFELTKLYEPLPESVCEESPDPKGKFPVCVRKDGS